MTVLSMQRVFVIQEYFSLFRNSFLTLVELISSGGLNKILNKDRETLIKLLWLSFVYTFGCYSMRMTTYFHGN